MTKHKLQWSTVVLQRKRTIGHKLELAFMLLMFLCQVFVHYSEDIICIMSNISTECLFRWSTVGYRQMRFYSSTICALLHRFFFFGNCFIFLVLLWYLQDISCISEQCAQVFVYHCQFLSLVFKTDLCLLSINLVDGTVCSISIQLLYHFHLQHTCSQTFFFHSENTQYVSKPKVCIWCFVC